MIYHDFIRGFKYRVEYIYIYIYIYIYLLGGVKLRDLKNIFVTIWGQLKVIWLVIKIVFNVYKN